MCTNTELLIELQVLQRVKLDKYFMCINCNFYARRGSYSNTDPNEIFMDGMTKQSLVIGNDHNLYQINDKMPLIAKLTNVTYSR